MLFAWVYDGLWQTGAGEDGVESTDGVRLDPVDLWEVATQRLQQLVATLKMPAAWLFRQS